MISGRRLPPYPDPTWIDGRMFLQHADGGLRLIRTIEQGEP